MGERAQEDFVEFRDGAKKHRLPYGRGAFLVGHQGFVRVA